jgi:ABC-type branched-subunit amino acid transport system substrate-binding protein
MAVAGIATVTVLAACSSGSSSSSAASGGGNASTSSSGKSPVKLMVILTENSDAANQPEAAGGAEAAAKAINAAGGINGHQVVIETCNDQFDPNVAAQCARQAVSDKVVAVAGSTTDYGESVLPVLADAKIPFIGGEAVTPQETNLSPVSFPLTAGIPLQIRGDGIILADMGMKDIALGSLDNPQGAVANAPITTMLKSGTTPNGKAVHYAGNVNLPLTASDYAPIASEFHAAGAEGAVLSSSTQANSATIKAVQQLGYKLRFASFDFVFGTAAIAALGSAGEGMVIDPSLPPTNATNLPGIKEFTTEMAAANSAGISNTSTSDYDTSSLKAWISVYAVQEASKGITGDLTSSALLNALNSAKTIDLKGLVNWQPAKKGPAGYARISNPNVYVTVVHNGVLQLQGTTQVNAAAGL